MNRLRVKGRKIIDSQGNEIHLRGTCLGGWMNLENFINGFPGCESGLRRAMEEELGKKKSHYFFECLLDNFFTEGDAAYISQIGANVVRVALNYRHFEDDERPFSYKDAGFRRLNSFLDLCEKYGLYVILDMHAAPGWQNAHWHSDNENAISLFWQQRQYRERLKGLWREIAGRYKDRSVVAGYELLNEPVTNTPAGDLPHMAFGNYKPRWKIMNSVYRELVDTIREIDIDHIIFLEGDCYGQLFEGLDSPFADNLVYSSHAYSLAGFGPGVYPGRFNKMKTSEVANGGDYFDKEQQFNTFKHSSGVQFCEKNNVPLWIGEFGSQYNTGVLDVPYRLRAMDDQLAIYNEWGANWTSWTYKDMGVMGVVTVNPKSEYAELIEPVQRMKTALGAENFVSWELDTPGKNANRALAEVIRNIIGNDSPSLSDITAGLSLFALTGYAAACLQPSFCHLFREKEQEDINRILSSFDLKNCVVNEPFEEILSMRLKEVNA
ncbi:MAG: glycoside hydrolase family 5 protein [Peptostreptococcaceae bacterium]|nr:glycoside hydrolase family 5 protein [Peptostreptococcaceae bacterium]